ncbi:MAG TPA: ATP cone domain-containing protein [Candidatus Saccharimonadales bacterium]|nr:ATP cone domain-containing protein [Candidatus Saccharimonadales bacterium]
MKCPFCREDTTDVFNTRPTKFGTQIWRRRRCLSCKESFTTYEAPDLAFVKVLKKSGRKQRYSRAKLYSGIHGAFLSIPAKETTVDAVTDTIEAKILDTKAQEISSAKIAEIVLTTLKHFNTPAFMRFLAFQASPANEAALKKELKKY